MLEVDIAEAEHSLRSLMERAQAGEEVVIIDESGKTIRLVPRDVKPFTPEDAKADLHRIRQRAKELGLGRFDWDEWKAYRDEGRR